MGCKLKCRMYLSYIEPKPWRLGAFPSGEYVAIVLYVEVDSLCPDSNKQAEVFACSGLTFRGEMFGSVRGGALHTRFLKRLYRY
jgi:hypothetical protein